MGKLSLYNIQKSRETNTWMDKKIKENKKIIKNQQQNVNTISWL